MTLRRIAPGLVLLALVLAAPARAQETTDGCDTQSGPVHLDSVEANVGGAWQDASGALCAFLTYQDQPATGDVPPIRYVSWGFSERASHNQDLSATYPEGTRLRVRLTATGVDPLSVVGTMSDPAVTVSGGSVVIEGKTATTRFATDGSANCTGDTVTMRSFFGGLVDLDTGGSSPSEQDMRAYRGAYFGTNAATSGFPTVGPDGQSIDVFLAGCGDGDPATLDGFFQGFIPTRGLREMGFGTRVLDALTDPVADELVVLEDNGDPAPAADVEVQDKALRAAASVGTTQLPDGLSIDYKLSFSQHNLSVRVDRRDLKLAARCVRAKGKKLKVSGKGRKRKLVCQAKRRRR